MYSNEPHGEAVAAGKLDKVDDFLVVDAAFDDGVDLDWAEAGFLSSEEAFEDGSEFATLGDLAVTVWIEAVDADVDAPQSGLLQIGDFLGEQGPVGGEAEITKPGQRRKTGDKIVQIAADQRFAARKADLGDADFDEMRARRSTSS